MKLLLHIGLMSISLNLFAASYEVPVAAELKKYATFQLSDLEKVIVGDNVVIDYSLPKVLTGVHESIRLEGKIQANKEETQLFGDKATATCSNISGGATCTIVYSNIEINEEKAIKEIKKISHSKEETLGRIEVMRAFSTDPVGIISY